MIPKRFEQIDATDFCTISAIDEPVGLLFDAFRDFTYLIKDKSGLDWVHLLPGIQRAAVVHLIKDRGKERTIDFLQIQILNIEPALQYFTPKNLPASCITRLHFTYMAKFNELILSAADEYANAGFHLRLTAHALSMLVIAITASHFDLFRIMATFEASCDEIAQGKYDAFQQAVFQSSPCR